MTFLPIVERELIEASRRRSTYWVRLFAAASGLGLGWMVLLAMRGSSTAEFGVGLFRTLAVACYLYCAFVGVFRTSDCLSEEKREGTLGLLFLTDLKGYDVVLGKLVATSLNAFYGALALFPVMAIPLLLGGVTLGEFWRVMMVSVNLLAFSLAVGMFCSSISRDERRAMVVALLIVLLFVAGLPLAAVIFENWRSTRPWVQYLMIPSPSYGAYLAFADTFKNGTGAKSFYSSVIVTHLLSWGLLLASSWIVPRTWQDRALSADAVRRRELWNQWRLGSAKQRQDVRRRSLELNPFYWLVARNRKKGMAVWAFLALGGFIWCLGLSFDAHDWADPGPYFCTALIAQTVLKVWIATEAARRFSLDRQSGALELLLSTPLSIREIVRGQLLGLERQFAGPAFVVLLADFVFLLQRLQENELISLWVALMVMFVADLVTLSWLGMWQGLRMGRPNRAAALALACVLAVPWVVFALLMMLGAFLLEGTRIRLGPKEVIFLGVCLGLGFDAWFALVARRGLLTRFREVVTQRFESRKRART